MKDLSHELLERLRRALSPYSTIDLEAHAEAIAGEVERVDRAHRETQERRRASGHAATGEGSTKGET